MSRRCATVALLFALLLGVLGRASPIAAATPYTQLILRVNASTTIALVLITNSACILANSNSNFAAIDLGAATKTAQFAGGCPAYTGGNTYKLVTSLAVEATCSGTCAKWNLTAQLPAGAATGLTWKLGGTTLTAAPQAITSNVNYATAQNEAFELDVKTNGGPNAAATGQVSQAIDFTATDTVTGTATATATLNAEEINEPGISLFFVQDASGAAITGGAFNAALDFGAVSAYGALPAGVTRPSLSGANYTLETFFDVKVEKGTLVSATYTLQADLASAAPTGLTYELDTVPLTTAMQTITATGAYATNQAYTLDIVILTAAPGVGPATGTVLSDTINVTATAN